MGRVYDPPGPAPEVRLLVDRLWPRGLRRDDPRGGSWHPHVAPSHELRLWFGHQPERYEQFVARYELELSHPEMTTALDEITQLAGQGPVVLVTASRDLAHSHVPVLVRWLADRNPPG